MTSSKLVKSGWRLRGVAATPDRQRDRARTTQTQSRRRTADAGRRRERMSPVPNTAPADPSVAVTTLP